MEQVVLAPDETPAGDRDALAAQVESIRATDGFLHGFEMPWWTDAPPTELPDAADLRPWRPRAYGP